MTAFESSIIHSRKRVIFVLWWNRTNQKCSVRKGVLRNFVKFTGKHLCQSLFFNKVVGVRASTLSKKGLWHGCFPADFAKFLGTLFLQNFCGRELLEFKQIESKNLLNHWKLFVMREMVSLKKRRSRSRSRGHEWKSLLQINAMNSFFS